MALNRKKKHEEHENHERWLVSYADFITLLFAFFVVMYAVSRVDVKRVTAAAQSVRWAMHLEGTGGVGAPPIFEGTPSEGGCMANLGPSPWSTPQVKKAMELLRRRLERRIGAMLMSRSLEKAVSVEEENGRLAVRLATTAMFDPSQASVRPEALPVLDAVAEELLALGRPIRVEGHADDAPISSERYASNWELSTARAAVVAAYLEAAHHFAPGKLSAAGYAASRPVAPNDTAEGRQANRRLELVIELEPGDVMKLAASQPVGEPTPTSVR